MAAGPAAFALALVPLAIGLGRYWVVHVGPGDLIWWQYRAVLLYPVDALVALAVVAWIARRRAAIAAAVRRGEPAIAGALVVFAILCAASALFAVDRIVALAIAAQLFVLALFFLAAVDLMRSGARALVLSGLAVAVIAQSALAAWQAITQSTAPAGALFNGWDIEFAARDSVAAVAALPGIDRWLRAYGSFPHPNALGIFLAASLVVLAISREAASRAGATALAAGIVGLSLTFSRTGWLALLLGAAAWIVASNGPRGSARWLRMQVRARPLIAAVVVIGIAFAGARLARLDTFAERNTFDERQLYDAAAWAMVDRGAPVGAGNLLIAEHRLGPGAAYGEPSHDVLLITLAELGPLAVVAWSLLFGALAATAWRQRERPAVRAAAVSALALLLPLLLLDHYLWTQPPGRVLLVWTLALIVGPRE